MSPRVEDPDSEPGTAPQVTDTGAAADGPAADGPAADGPADSDPADSDPARSLLQKARSDARHQRRVPVSRAAQAKARREGSQRRSSAGADDRDPQPLGRVVAKLLGEQGWQVEVAVHGVMTRWAEVVGPQVAAHSAPEGYNDGELVVRAESTAWATQLRLLAPKLVHRLNSVLGDGTVRVVIVRGPDASWSHGRRTVPGRGPRDTYG